jgi:hypothetical protein
MSAMPCIAHNLALARRMGQALVYRGAADSCTPYHQSNHVITPSLGRPISNLNESAQARFKEKVETERTIRGEDILWSACCSKDSLKRPRRYVLRTLTRCALTFHQLARSVFPVRTLATAASIPSSAASSSSAAGAPSDAKARARARLDDGLSFDDFVSGEELPPKESRVTLGNTKQYVFRVSAMGAPVLTLL